MSKGTILVVEDEESFVDALTVGLGREGFEVAVARTGAEALEMFPSVEPDLVLLDVMLPTVSGLDVCRELRARSSVPEDYEALAQDLDRHEVTVRGELVNLPLKEFELLAVLMENPGRVLPRATLIDRVWGGDYVGDTKTLDVHIKRLRSRVEAEPSAPERIITVRGVGYKFVPSG